MNSRGGEQRQETEVEWRKEKYIKKKKKKKKERYRNPKENMSDRNRGMH